ncbi:MAG: tripartite tricarboxylate transporter substrate binding protein, partial [Comamonadaceae bacterium]
MHHDNGDSGGAPGLRRRHLLGAALAAACTTAGAQADRLDGPIRIVLPFGPGSGTDVYARLVAQQLGAALGVTMVIDNKPGANGVLAADAVARARPDGTTLLFTTNT